MDIKTPREYFLDEAIKRHWNVLYGSKIGLDFCKEYANYYHQAKLKELGEADVSGSLQNCKKVIKDLLNMYVINVHKNGITKATITEALELTDRALNLISDNTLTPDDRGEELKCPECNSDDLKNAIYTEYKECNECYHYWEANQPQTK